VYACQQQDPVHQAEGVESRLGLHGLSGSAKLLHFTAAILNLSKESIDLTDRRKNVAPHPLFSNG